MNTVIVDTKAVPENIELAIDFLSRLDAGETLQTCAANISVKSGVDPTPSSMLVGLPVISGSVVSQNVQSGIAGVIYTVAISARTNQNNIYVMEADLVVTSSNAIAPP